MIQGLIMICGYEGRFTLAFLTSSKETGVSPVMDLFLFYADSWPSYSAYLSAGGLRWSTKC